MLAEHARRLTADGGVGGKVLAPKLTQEFGLTGIIFYPGQRDLNERITWVDSERFMGASDISGSDQARGDFADGHRRTGISE